MASTELLKKSEADFRIEIAGTIKLPPSPVITRWCTWLNAAFYYSEHFDSVTNVLNSLDKEEAASIRMSQSLVKKRNIVAQLAFINAQFRFIPEMIEKIQNPKLTLFDSLALINSFELHVDSLPDTASYVKVKKFYVFDNNNGLQDLKEICDILNGRISDSRFFKIYTGCELGKY
ncbi:uncharacterized protein B4U80_05602, partial [Leptotrombidium deliense]